MSGEADLHCALRLQAVEPFNEGVSSGVALAEFGDALREGVGFVLPLCDGFEVAEQKDRPVVACRAAPANLGFDLRSDRIAALLNLGLPGAERASGLLVAPPLVGQ